MAIPAIVPSSVAVRLEVSAMNSEFLAASSISSSFSSTWYQCQVNPTHSAFRRESLNEYTTTMVSGRYRKAYTDSAPAHSHGPLRIAPPPPRKSRGEPHDQQHRESQHDRQRGAERPVARAEELLLDQVPDQHVAGATEDVGDGEHAENRNEHQCGAGKDARQRQ